MLKQIAIVQESIFIKNRTIFSGRLFPDEFGSKDISISALKRSLLSKKFLINSPIVGAGLPSGSIGKEFSVKSGQKEDA